jgi:carbon storage regulator
MDAGQIRSARFWSNGMLILSRKQGEAILVDGGIRIVVLATDNGGVRLGIEAPSHIGIVREEIVNRITEENIRAGATSADRAFVESLKKPSDAAPGEEGKGGVPKAQPRVLGEEVNGEAAAEEDPETDPTDSD